jgi:hypothetical protein
MFEVTSPPTRGSPAAGSLDACRNRRDLKLDFDSSGWAQTHRPGAGDAVTQLKRCGAFLVGDGRAPRASHDSALTAMTLLQRGKDG